jgi:hypothetical protein
MGRDFVTGRSFDHRREWVQNRLCWLASIFAFDHLNFAILGNHLHVLVRNRPDIRDAWTDEEVVRRWLRLFPLRNPRGKPLELTPEVLCELVQDQEWLTERRRRLGDISWFMRCLSEDIANRANAEEEISSRFWQGRFRMVRILDEAGLLACAMYIDLNPIRARLAETPETSFFTSVYIRLQAMKLQGETLAGRSDCGNEPSATSSEAPDCWLSPVELVESTEVDVSPPTQRASNLGYLSVTFAKYLSLLDWTGREIRSDKRGSIPADLAPIFERLGINGEIWVDAICNFSRWFKTAVGRAEQVAQEATRAGRQYLHGTSRCQAVFG